jgi:hypothetical protein
MFVQTAPLQQSTSMQHVLTPVNTAADQLRGDGAADNSTGGSSTSAANASESIGYFRPVEFAGINFIGWLADRRNSTCCKLSHPEISNFRM